MKHETARKVGRLLAQIVIAIIILIGMAIVAHFDQVAINMGMLH